MPYCSNCGRELNSGSVYCPECGIKLSQENEDGTDFRSDDVLMRKKCPNCGELMPNDMFYCLNCGFQFADMTEGTLYDDENLQDIVHRVQKTEGTWKNKWVSLFLCIFFGWLGIHKFYEGKPFIGLLYLFTLGLFGVGWIVDIIRLALKPNPYRVK